MKAVFCAGEKGRILFKLSPKAFLLKMLKGGLTDGDENLCARE